jgi:hypothetical protein
VERSGVSLYNRILKPDRGQLEKLNPKQWGDTIDERAMNMSESLIKEGVNVTPTGVDKIAANVDRLGQERAGIIKDLDGFHPANNPTGNVARVSTDPLGASIDSASDFAGRQLDNAGPIATVQAGHDKLLKNHLLTKRKRSTIGGLPPEVAKAELGVATKDAGRELLPNVRLSKGNAYGGGRLPEDIAGEKALLDGANTAIASADPKLRPISQEMGRQITMEDFLERGSLRSGKHELMSGFDLMVGSNNPGWLALRAAQRPGIGSTAARGLYNAGSNMKRMELSPLQQRMALLAALGGRDE